MIRPLRRRHRWMFAGLALLLPLGVVTGLAARRPVPLATVEPEGGPERPRPDRPLLLDRDDLWGELSVSTEVRGLPGEELTLTLQARTDLLRPDVLAYWSASTATEERLPEDALLLGALRGTAVARFPLPSSATAGGTLVLYSLGHQQVVAMATVPRLSGRD